MVIPGPGGQRVNGVLLQGRELALCAAMFTFGVRAHERQNGYTAPGAVRDLADLLTTAARAVSAPGLPDVPEQPDPASSIADEITTTEAARMLGICPRQARRLMPALGARHTTAGWLVTRGIVAAHLTERNAA